MTDKKTLTFMLMDPPFESTRSTTALRLMQIAAERGYDIYVLAYEGAVYLPFNGQAGHPNPIHGNDVSQENHPLPKEWVKIIAQTAKANGGNDASEKAVALALQWIASRQAQDGGWNFNSHSSIIVI